MRSVSDAKKKMWTSGKQKKCYFHTWNTGVRCNTSHMVVCVLRWHQSGKLYFFKYEHSMTGVGFHVLKSGINIYRLRLFRFIIPQTVFILYYIKISDQIHLLKHGFYLNSTKKIHVLPRVSMETTSRRMLFTEITCIYPSNHTTPLNTDCGRSSEYFNVNTSHTHIQRYVMHVITTPV
jgi:hypothetical protein